MSEAARPLVPVPANQPLPVGDSLIDDAIAAPFDVEKAVQRLTRIQEFFRQVMKGPTYDDAGKLVAQGEDYGPAYPGSKAIILYRSGADKFCQFLGVVARPNVTTRIEQFGLAPNEIAFFHFEMTTELVSLRTGRIVAYGMGSCNSREVKYRYRTANRKCPACNVEAIFRSRWAKKSTDEKGWYCNQNKGGCGEEFKAKDPRILEQHVGQTENTEIADLHHTILRVAKKRANGDAIVTISRAVGFLVADVRDHDEDDEEEHGDGKDKPTASDPKLETVNEDERKGLYDAYTKAGHKVADVTRWVLEQFKFDMTKQGVPRAHYPAILERVRKPEPLFPGEQKSGAKGKDGALL